MTDILLRFRVSPHVWNMERPVKILFSVWCIWKFNQALQQATNNISSYSLNIRLLSSSHEQLNQVRLKSRTTNFRGEENWSTLIDLQLLQTDACVSTIKGCKSITVLQFLRVLTCQASVQCSHVLHTVAGRPLGSKLGVRPPENPYLAHTAPELNTTTHAINKHIIIYKVSHVCKEHWPGVEDLSDTLLLRCGRSSSSLKLLSWLGSKSSSAAMLSISRLTAPLEGCKITHKGFDFATLITHLRGGIINCMKCICLYSKNPDDDDDDEMILMLRKVDLWQPTKPPGWQATNELFKGKRQHITTLMLLNTQSSLPFRRHKELCAHTLSAFHVSKTNSSFGLVADGEQCNTLAQIAPHKWFHFFFFLSRQQNKKVLIATQAIC